MGESNKIFSHFVILGSSSFFFFNFSFYRFGWSPSTNTSEAAVDFQVIFNLSLFLFQILFSLFVSDFVYIFIIACITINSKHDEIFTYFLGIN